MEQEIQKIYEKAGYLQKYGVSVFIAVVILLIAIALIAYVNSISLLQDMKTNWAANKCNPIYMPFAGMVAPTPGVSAFDTNMENFNFCVQSDISSIFSTIMLPVEFAMYVVVDAMDFAISAAAALSQTIQAFQSMLGGLFEEIFNKINNFLVPVVVMSLHMRDGLAKTNGVLVNVLYTIMGVYNFTVSGIANLLKFTVDMILFVAAIITAIMVIVVILASNFFTWPVALVTVLTALVFEAFALFLLHLYIVMQGFTSEVLKIATSDPPSVPSTSVRKK